MPHSREARSAAPAEQQRADDEDEPVAHVTEHHPEHDDVRDRGEPHRVYVSVRDGRVRVDQRAQCGGRPTGRQRGRHVHPSGDGHLDHRTTQWREPFSQRLDGGRRRPSGQCRDLVSLQRTVAHTLQLRFSREQLCATCRAQRVHVGRLEGEHRSAWRRDRSRCHGPPVDARSAGRLFGLDHPAVGHRDQHASPSACRRDDRDSAHRRSGREGHATASNSSKPAGSPCRSLQRRADMVGVGEQQHRRPRDGGLALRRPPGLTGRF